MYSFEYLKSVISVENKINYVHINLLRNINIEADYTNHKSKCKEKYGSLFNYVTTQVITNFEKPIVVTKNTFPYNFEKDITHNLIWSKTQLYNDEILKVIHDNINCDIYDYLWFENVIKNKSIPDIFHVHLILRKKPV